MDLYYFFINNFNINQVLLISALVLFTILPFLSKNYSNLKKKYTTKQVVSFLIQISAFILLVIFQYINRNIPATIFSLLNLIIRIIFLIINYVV